MAKNLQKLSESERQRIATRASQMLEDLDAL